MADEHNELLYKENDLHHLIIRAKGHITANICAKLKEKVLERMTQQPRVEAVIVDLASCHYMDSTFLGVLLTFNRGLKKIRHKEVEIQKPTDECVKILKQMGIARMFDITQTTNELPSEEMEMVSGTCDLTPEFLLQAHELLADISDENKKRFELPISLLREEMNKKAKG